MNEGLGELRCRRHFLVELHILRISKAHAENEAKGITETIYKIHDEMQDERGLLVR